jgi:hypothetical protein
MLTTLCKLVKISTKKIPMKLVSPQSVRCLTHVKLIISILSINGRLKIMTQRMMETDLSNSLLISASRHFIFLMNFSFMFFHSELCTYIKFRLISPCPTDKGIVVINCSRSVCLWNYLPRFILSSIILQFHGLMKMYTCTSTPLWKPRVYVLLLAGF